MKKKKYAHFEDYLRFNGGLHKHIYIPVIEVYNYLNDYDESTSFYGNTFIKIKDIKVDKINVFRLSDTKSILSGGKLGLEMTISLKRDVAPIKATITSEDDYGRFFVNIVYTKKVHYIHHNDDDIHTYPTTKLICVDKHHYKWFYKLITSSLKDAQKLLRRRKQLLDKCKDKKCNDKRLTKQLDKVDIQLSALLNKHY